MSHHPDPDDRDQGRGDPDAPDVDADDPDAPDVDADDPDAPDVDADDPDDDRQTFDRAYVSKLRTENGENRRKARDADAAATELRATLWTERVDRLGLLADPTDLPVDLDKLDDPEAIRAAVDDLLTTKPHLRSRRIRERAGQGEGSPTGGVSLSALLSRGA